MNGQPPALAGKHCDAIICQQFWYQGELSAPAHVIHLQFDESWYRLYFDCGVIFWREEDEAPKAWAVPEEGWDYPLADLGASAKLVGLRLAAYDMESFPGGSRIAFRFEGGRTLTFEDVGDRTHFVIEP